MFCSGTGSAFNVDLMPHCDLVPHAAGLAEALSIMKADYVLLADSVSASDELREDDFAAVVRYLMKGRMQHQRNTPREMAILLPPDDRAPAQSAAGLC